MTPLTGPRRRPAAGGAPRQLVVLLHGLGADGHDLIGLAEPWAQALPHAEFLAPNAPDPCDGAPFGYQWFPLREITPVQLLAGAEAAAPRLDAFLDAALAERSLTDAQLALVGFSQGAMMALHVALRRPRPCAGIIGYSGALVGAETLAGAVRSRPPVLLVHGTADQVVPVYALHLATAALRRAGVPVTTLVRPGLAHGVDEEGIRQGLAFLARHLAAPGASPEIVSAS